MYNSPWFQFNFIKKFFFLIPYKVLQHQHTSSLPMWIKYKKQHLVSHHFDHYRWI